MYIDNEYGCVIWNENGYYDNYDNNNNNNNNY